MADFQQPPLANEILSEHSTKGSETSTKRGTILKRTTMKHFESAAEPSRDLFIPLHSLADLQNSDLSSASVPPSFKQETSTTVIDIRPTYIPRTTTEQITNPLLDPTFQPISKNTDSRPVIKKSSFFPGKSSASVHKSVHVLNFFLVILLTCVSLPSGIFSEFALSS